MGSHGVDPAIHLVLAAVPFYGHTRPLRSLAQSLVQRGYPVTFIGGRKYQASFEAFGVEYVPLSGYADFDGDQLDIGFPERALVPRDATRVIWDTEHIFLKPMADQYSLTQSVLHRLAHKRVVLICDAIFVGTVPMLLGAANSRRVPEIAIAGYPLLTLSKDCAPFGFGLPPQGPVKNQELNEIAVQAMSGPQALLEKLLEPHQCEKSLPSSYVFDNLLGSTHDLYLQL